MTNKRYDIYEELTGYNLNETTSYGLKNITIKTSYRMDKETINMLALIKKHTRLPARMIIKPFLKDLTTKLVKYNENIVEQEIKDLEEQIKFLKTKVSW